MVRGDGAPGSKAAPCTRLDNFGNSLLRSRSAFERVGQINLLKSQIAGTSAGLTISLQAPEDDTLLGPSRHDPSSCDSAPPFCRHRI